MLLILAAVLLIIVGLVMFPADTATGNSPAAALSGTPAAQAHLPVIRYDASPTPPPTPTPFPVNAEAVLYITPFGPLNASTFTTGSFVLENKSSGGELIRQIIIDLRTAVFPDMVYDPFGAAGDQVAKDLTVDATVGLKYKGHAYESPHDGGFDVLIMNFAEFDPGDSIAFSVDVDPTSIKGSSAPGPGESGSVCGLELVGSTVTVVFESGLTLTSQLVPVADPARLGGAWAIVREGLPHAPPVTIAGVTPPALVAEPQQTVHISGSAGQPVEVMVIEGGLFTDGLPGGGHDIEPFEANNALGYRRYTAVLGPGGGVDVNISLSRSRPEGGLNHITAAFDNFYGVKGLVAPVQVLELP